MADVLAVRNEYRVENWSALIQECNASGLSNREFCRQHGISEKSFYYWLRKLRHQAAEAAERLKEVPFEIAFCSPLIRARHTAETIVGERKITLTTDERLRELNFGPWEGTDVRKIREGANSPFTDPGSYLPPEGAESFAQLYARSGEFVKQVLLPLEGTYETVLVVAHGALNRSILNAVLDIPVSDFWHFHMGNCATAILECREGKLSLLEYQDSESVNTKSKLL